MAELRSSKPTTGVRFSLLLSLRKAWFTPKYRRQTPKTISYLKQFWVKKWLNSDFPFKKDLPLARSCWAVNRQSTKIIHNTSLSLKHSLNLFVSIRKKLIGVCVSSNYLQLLTNYNRFLNIFVVKSSSYSSLGSFMGWTGAVFLKNRKLAGRDFSNLFNIKSSSNTVNIKSIKSPNNFTTDLTVSVVKMRSKLTHFHSKNLYPKSLNSRNLIRLYKTHTQLNRVQKLYIDTRLNEGHAKRSWLSFDQLAYSRVKKGRAKRFTSRRLRNLFRLNLKKIHFSHNIYYSKTFSARTILKNRPNPRLLIKPITLFWINSLLFKSNAYLEYLCRVDEFLPIYNQRRVMGYSRKSVRFTHATRNFDLKYSLAGGTSDLLNIITLNISHVLASTLTGSLLANNLSSRLSNNVGFSLSTSSSAARFLLKAVFAGELEDYILKNYAGQYFFKTSFEPINERYASVYLTSLINKFFTYQLASSVLTSITFDFYKKLTFSEQVRLRDFTSRLILFSSQFSTIFFLSEFIDVIYFSLKLCNLTIIFDYVQRVLRKLVIWDHKKFLFFLFNLYKEQMYPLFDYLGIRGLKILIKGKVGVGGNSRKRSIALVLGSTTSTALYSSAHSINRLLSTTTGALGFRVWMLYRKPTHPYAGREV